MDEWKSEKERGWGICVRVCVCVCVYARFLVVSLPASCLSTGFHPLVRWCPLSLDSLQTLLYMSIYIHTYSHTSCIRFFFFFAAFPSMLCETYPPTHARTQTHTYIRTDTHPLSVRTFDGRFLCLFLLPSSPQLVWRTGKRFTNSTKGERAKRTRNRNVTYERREREGEGRISSPSGYEGGERGRLGPSTTSCENAHPHSLGP